MLSLADHDIFGLWFADRAGLGWVHHGASCDEPTDVSWPRDLCSIVAQACASISEIAVRSSFLPLAALITTSEPLVPISAACNDMLPLMALASLSL